MITNHLLAVALLYLSAASWQVTMPVVVYAQDECFECHADPDLTSEDDAGKEISLFVDQEEYLYSIHGDFDCTDCHADVDIEEHPGEPGEGVDCGICHEDVVEPHLLSVHGQSVENGSGDAATCSGCHGKHNILPASDVVSLIHPLNLAATCAQCHADPKIAKKYDISISDPLAAYRESVHGLAVLSEHNFAAANCVSCHGGHSIRSMGDPASPIFWKNVPETCGQCHQDIYKTYTESVHWRAAKKGIRDAPVCTDCHGEHSVKSPDDPESPVHPLRVSDKTCERCHASELITERYGMRESRAETFENSFHGLAVKAGSLKAANCASCHGIHNILPSSDPQSTINPANLEATCGSCHPKTTTNFAQGRIHLTTTSRPGIIVNYVRIAYFWLIVVVIGGMIVHNGVDFIKKSRQQLKQRREA